MPKKNKHFIIKLAIYKQDVFVSISETDDELSKCLKKILPTYCHEQIDMLKLSETNGGKCGIFKNGAICIRLKNTPKSCNDYGVLAHEIFHAIELMANRIGLIHTWEESSEAFAYAIEYLTVEIYKNL